MNRKSIYNYYENLINKIEDENLKNELFDDLEEIDDMIYSLKKRIEEEIDYQENHLPAIEEII